MKAVEYRDVVGYGRYSPRPTKKRGEALRDCESIEVQRDRVTAFCTAMGWKLVAWYDDPFKSGKTTAGRDGLEKALAHVCRVRGVLVVFSLSRLSRHVGDTQRIAERLSKRKAALASVSEVISTTTAFGRAMFLMSAVWAQLEREQTSERTSTAMLHHQQGGRRMSRADRCPFGFRPAPDGTTLESEPAEQAAILRIRELSATGISNREVCRVLDGDGIMFRGHGWEGRHGLIAKVIRA